jgi:hypothetical protein
VAFRGRCFGAFGWAVCLGYWLVVSEEGESGQTKKAHLSVSLFAKSGAAPEVEK